MMKHNNDNQDILNVLVFEYEAMSQQGTVGFYEKTVFLKLIEYYKNEDRLQSALHVAIHAVEQHPCSAELFLSQAQLFSELAQYENALEALQQAASFAPNDLEVQLLTAEVHLALDDEQLAFGIIRRLRDQYANQKEAFAEVLYCEGCMYEHLELFDNMFITLKQAALTFPSQSILQRLWVSIECTKRYQESVELHTQLIDNNPFCPISWYNIGHAYNCLGLPKKADMAFEYAYINEPGFTTAYKDRADILIAQNEYVEAIECFDEAILNAKVDSEIYVAQGYCYEHLKDFESAILCYRMAIELDEEDDAAHYRIGECLARQGKWNEAILAYQKAIKINVLFEEYIAALAIAYCEIREYDKAKKLFMKVTEIAPEQSQYWLQYACFLMDMGNITEALENLDIGIENAGGSELNNCKVVCLLMSKKRKEALKLFSQLLRCDPDAGRTLLKLAPELADDPDVRLLIKAS